MTILFGWTTALGPAGYVVLGYYMTSAAGMNTGGEASVVDGASIINALFGWQLWLVVIPITTKIGANIIADDIAQKAFPFFFTKPLSRAHYLAGRMAAVGSLVWALTWVPALLVVLTLCLTAAPGDFLHRAFLLAPSTAYALIIAVVIATTAVGVSALSHRRAVTMTAWLLLWIVPHVGSRLATLFSESTWAHMASLPSLLENIGQSLFQLTEQAGSLGHVPWYYAALYLGILVAASIGAARWRLLQIGVIQ
ncbi:MAG: hypothetical protein H6715_01645 [Myxococcales bacterium]|nr:hypothetical protein [Myxococcales bacterium]